MLLSKPMATSYTAQDRGEDEAYERYLRGMDQSMRQKVALTAAHLLGEGRVADMGMGSGSGTLALAALYPRVHVIGVDVNPEMVGRARERHQLPNLAFEEGDIAAPVFEPGSLDAVFDSSVLHHVTSFNGYDHEAAARALAVQAEQLAIGGSLIVRDFVAPEPKEVLLDLPDDDGSPALGGDEPPDPTTCSTASLFVRFAREFRKLSDSPGFGYSRVDAGLPLRKGWARFRVEARLAAEFLLRKDYRADWESEVLEEYTYFTQRRFESEFAKLGLRLLVSMPIHNPWIVENRFVDRCALWSKDAEPLPFPATNHLIVGEKVAVDEGVAFTAKSPAEPCGFLQRHSFERRSGGRRELVRRPGTALDVVPWFRDGGALYVLARKSHPRPVLQAPEASHSLDGAAAVGYVTEPILVVQSDAPVGLTVERVLEEVADVSPRDVARLEEVATYYPSPGGLVEEVRAVHVKIPPSYVQGDVHNQTGFSTSGRVRAIDARQVLRAAQVGALPDVRLELNVYELLRREREDPGPWIGPSLTLPQASAPVAAVTRFRESQPEPRREYLPIENEGFQFLDLRCQLFSELDSNGSVLHQHPREYVVPATLSVSTIACALLWRQGDEYLIGLDDDDLAAAQCFTGSSALWVAPAWRLPRSIADLSSAEGWVSERLREEYGLVTGPFTELGGKYYPSAGVTPEAVYPRAVPVLSEQTGSRSVRWFELEDLLVSIDGVRDGHLRIAVLRAAHALGLLGPTALDAP